MTFNCSCRRYIFSQGIELTFEPLTFIFTSNLLAAPGKAAEEQSWTDQVCSTLLISLGYIWPSSALCTRIPFAPKGQLPKVRNGHCFFRLLTVINPDCFGSPSNRSQLISSNSPPQDLLSVFILCAGLPYKAMTNIFPDQWLLLGK